MNFFTLFSKPSNHHHSSTTSKCPLSKHHPKAQNERSPVLMSTGQKCPKPEPQGNEKPQPPPKPRKCIFMDNMCINHALLLFTTLQPTKKTNKEKPDQKSPHPCNQWPVSLHQVIVIFRISFLYEKSDNCLHSM